MESIALRRVLLGIAALMGAAAILLALFLADTDDNDVTVTGNAAVDELIPPRNAEVLSQETIGIDLAPGYDARLTINGVDIPLARYDISPISIDSLSDPTKAR